MSIVRNEPLEMLEEPTDQVRNTYFILVEEEEFALMGPYRGLLWAAVFEGSAFLLIVGAGFLWHLLQRGR